MVKPSMISKLKKGKEPWPLGAEFLRRSRGGESEKNRIAPRDPLKYRSGKPFEIVKGSS